MVNIWKLALLRIFFFFLLMTFLINSGFYLDRTIPVVTGITNDSCVVTEHLEYKRERPKHGGDSPETVPECFKEKQR